MWRIIPPVCAPHHHDTIQGWAKKRSLGLVNFVPAVDYHFSLALPAAFSRALFWDAICLRGLQRSSDNNLHATAHIARAHLFCTPQFNVDPQVGVSGIRSDPLVVSVEFTAPFLSKIPDD